MSTSIHDLEQRAAEAYERVRRSNDYEAWVIMGEALLAGRQLAMQQSGARIAKGASYNRALAQWHARNPWALAPELKHPTTSQAVWLAENLSDVEAWRATLPETERLSYNHPGTIWRHFHGKARSGSGGRRGGGAGPSPSNPNRPSKVAYDALRDAFDAKCAECDAKDKTIAELEAKLASSGPAGYPELPLLWLTLPVSEKVARAAYRRMSKVCHPDTGGSDERMTALSRELGKALGSAAKP